MSETNPWWCRSRSIRSERVGRPIPLYTMGSRHWPTTSAMPLQLSNTGLRRITAVCANYLGQQWRCARRTVCWLSRAHLWPDNAGTLLGLSDRKRRCMGLLHCANSRRHQTIAQCIASIALFIAQCIASTGQSQYRTTRRQGCSKAHRRSRNASRQLSASKRLALDGTKRTPSAAVRYTCARGACAKNRDGYGNG